MDLATLVGIIGAFGIVLAAMVLGGSVLVFINVPSLLIVILGTLMVVLIKFTFGQCLGAFKVALKAFIFKLDSMETLIPTVVEMADTARKGGLLALEGKEIENQFLQEGVKMLVDGHDGDIVKSVLGKDMRQSTERHAWGAKVFTAMGDVAPAMGMIGTLVGLVQMLSAMDDPKSIGPAMAVALLTTLYGAILANMVAIPIADKLDLRKAEESRLKSMIIDALMAIQGGQNPRVVESMLKTYLSPSKRVDKEASS